jgi:hypothetical protein
MSWIYSINSLTNSLHQIYSQSIFFHVSVISYLVVLTSSHIVRNKLSWDQRNNYSRRNKLNCNKWVAYIQSKLIYSVINQNLSSSSFLIFTPSNFDIFSYQSYEKGGWNHRLAKYLFWDIDVNFIPCLFFFPILIISFSNFNCWYALCHSTFCFFCSSHTYDINLFGILCW